MKKLNRIFLTGLTAALLLNGAAIPIAAEEAEITVTVDGAKIAFPDQEPIIQNSRTLVPVRFIAEALGYSVEWDPEVDAAVIDDGKIVLYIGTTRAEINGEERILDVASTLINDRTMVPIRVVAETLGCTVDWLAESQTVQITSGADTDLWTRLCNSGMFAFDDNISGGYYGCGVLGDKFSETQYYKWHINRNENLYEGCDGYDCEIYVDSFDEQTLREVRDVLMIAYPTEYETVYDLFIRSVKGELWECFRANAGYVASGTFGTHYADGREVAIYTAYGLPYTVITIKDIGYINPETPLKLAEKDIAEWCRLAKQDYLLDYYGLND